MKNKRKIISKMNEGIDPDVEKYTWLTIPDSLKKFWENHFNNQSK